MTTANKYLILALTVISGFGIISCGPQKMGNATSPSTNGGGTVSAGNKPVLSCSADVANISDLGVKLQTYSMSGAENSAWIRVRFTRFPTSFNTDQIISFWAYSVDSVGTPSAMQQPKFYVEYINSSNQAVKLSNDLDSITWSDLRNMAGQAGITTTNAADTMSKLNFVVKFEGTLTYSQVVMPTLYLANGTADRYISALIPKFYANPADYAIGKPAALQGLHPLKGFSYSTSEQYLSQSITNCIL